MVVKEDRDMITYIKPAQVSNFPMVSNFLFLTNLGDLRNIAFPENIYDGPEVSHFLLKSFLAFAQNLIFGFRLKFHF